MVRVSGSVGGYEQTRRRRIALLVRRKSYDGGEYGLEYIPAASPEVSSLFQMYVGPINPVNPAAPAGPLSVPNSMGCVFWIEPVVN